MRYVAVTPVRLNGPACWHALRERSSQPAGLTHPQRAGRPHMTSMKADGPRNDCGAYVAQADFVRTAVGKATRRGPQQASVAACHADRPGRAGVANADRESKLVGMPVPWTCDLDRTSRSCRVFCSLQCMACVHWSTQATAAALVHRQMAMRPLWRRSNAEEGHRHWAALCSGELTHTYSGKKDAPPPPLLVTTPYSPRPCELLLLRA